MLIICPRTRQNNYLGGQLNWQLKWKKAYIKHDKLINNTVMTVASEVDLLLTL